MPSVEPFGRAADDDPAVWLKGDGLCHVPSAEVGHRLPAVERPVGQARAVEARDPKVDIRVRTPAPHSHRDESSVRLAGEVARATGRDRDSVSGDAERAVEGAAGGVADEPWCTPKLPPMTSLPSGCATTPPQAPLSSGALTRMPSAPKLGSRFPSVS